MSRDFDSNNKTSPMLKRLKSRGKWAVEAYPENNGIGPKMIKDLGFIERIHYGLIDHENNSVIPNEEYIVSTTNGRVFDFVADSYSLMRLNQTTAVERGLVSLEGSALGNLDMIKSYTNPKLKYGEYLGNILRAYNETHIPNVVGIINIPSYEAYVNNFFDFFEKNSNELPLTMTRWNTSIFSSVLNTGLAFQYAEINYDADQEKIDQIVDHPSFEYLKNASMNFGFSILHNTPQILLYDMVSPAGSSIRNSYGLYNLGFLFNRRFIKTYTIDMNYLFTYINIYYNKYAQKNSQTKIVSVKCGKTVSEYLRLSTISINTRPYSDLQELHLYCKFRNIEEGYPFSSQKVEGIYKKAKMLLKRLDKASAMSYINDEFKDQVWNKDFGFHDLKAKLEGKTITQSKRDQFGANPGGGGSSSY
jgi:hypothetical protein